MKKYLFIATALVALASCSSDEFVGDNTSPTTSNTPGAIQFTSNTPRITRDAGTETDAKTLGYSFAVYATKTTPDGPDEGTDPDISNVFAHNAYGTTNVPYWVWYNSSTAHTTTSNTSNWEYVGAAGEKDIPENGKFDLPNTQTIKYWDYSATQYEFVAYKVKHTTTSGQETTPLITDYSTTGFTVKATAEDLAGLYVADKVTLTATDDTDSDPTKPATSINKIGGIVQFTFRAAGSKVRLGIYETINGYEVRNVKFYYTNSGEQSSTTNAILSGSFNGSSNSGTATYTVRYDPYAIFETSTTASTYFDFGTFDTNANSNPVTDILGITSTAPTWAGGSEAYSAVFPNTDHVTDMVLKVDYDLHNTTSGETIHVYGARAVVPAIYMTWNPNYAYTYLFKISDNTNGATSQTSGTPEGLFPITFDALTIAAAEEQGVGIITTVSTPAITTYQENSVVDIEDTQSNPAVSEHGITYAHANGPIYITVNEDGTLKSLTTTNTQLYTVPTGTTEADLILGTVSASDKVAVTGTNALSILDANDIKQGITFSSGKAAKFTPADDTTYAVEYQVSAAVLYTNESEYNTAKGTSLDATAFAALSDAEKTKTPAVYQYKIIIVGTPT